MAVRVRYTMHNGRLVGENRGGTKRDYVPDPLGSTVALLDNAQAQTDTFTYWPYGEQRVTSGPGLTRLQYVGLMGYSSDSGARCYVRARSLMTSKGRWMTKDPVASPTAVDLGRLLNRVSIGYRGANLYAYVSNNPLSSTDVSGLAEIRIVPPRAGEHVKHHAYIYLKGRCIGSHSFGFWPNRGPIGNIHHDDLAYESGDEYYVLPGDRNDKPGFERELCWCIKQSTIAQPPYLAPGYMCGDWARDMWRCAISHFFTDVRSHHPTVPPIEYFYNL